MTPEQTSLIRSSFAKVLCDEAAVGRLFYDRLFTIAPEVRPLFKTDMEAQSRKLMETLAVAVNALRDMPRLLATLEALGRRHKGYGVQPRHYAKVGDALLWTLERSIGPGFDARARAAWVELFGVVAATMEPAVAA